jgi:23S rRNA (uracil1939-C5)-methyltransferase
MRSRNPIILPQVTIEGMAAKGKAFGRAADQRIVFVPYAAPGDIADIRVTKKRSNYYEGVIEALHKASPDRIEPKCAHFGLCGGCKWQHISYEAQLAGKQDEVVQHLKRIGGVSPDHIGEILGCEDPYYYRNKMEFSFSDSKWLTPEEIASDKNFNRNALGFHKPQMWDKVIDLEACHLQSDPSNAIRNFCKEEAERQSLRFFNPRHQSGDLRTLMIRNTQGDQLMVLIQFCEASEEAIQRYLSAIISAFPTIHSLLYTINTKANDTLYDQEIHCFHGADFIKEEMEGLRFAIDAKSFYQTNSKQAYRLYQVVREFAQIKSSDTVYDLYTGTGTIAQFVAKNAQKVIGVESVPEAIQKAQENAIVNGIHNVHFEVGDMRTVFNDDFIARHSKADVVITDPPRDGMHPDVVEQLLKLNAPRIVYVSCNSATQARDLQRLSTSYRTLKSQAVDMFPQTHHVENVVLLELR